MAAYSDSEASQKASAQILFGFSGTQGKLPITIPGMYEFGEGIMLPQIRTRRGYPEEVGLSSDLLARSDSLLRSAIKDEAFPGAAVAVGREDVLIKLDSYGYFTYDSEQQVRTNSLFDLASLTKVCCYYYRSHCNSMNEGGLISKTRLPAIYPQFGQNGKDGITVRQLLTHTSGLRPFRPFHEEGILTRNGVINEIYSEELTFTPGSESKYSDFNMILMALIIEKVSGQSFATYAKSNIFDPLGMRATGFRRAGRGSDRSVVPTEYDEGFRKKLMQGEVHDETAFILGGTAGHAGLFSTVEDLSRFAFMLINQGLHEGRQFLKPETIELFTTAVAPENHTRALGWDTKSPEGYSSAGQYFSPRSFGHTGFTGTSMWIDPETKLFVILLSNRVYPTRDNKKHVAVRSELADIVHTSIVGPIEVILPSVPE